MTELIQKTISKIIRDILEKLMGGNLGFAKLLEEPKKEEGDSEPKIVERPQLFGNAVGASRKMRSTNCTQKWRPPRPQVITKRMTARMRDEGDRKYRRIPMNRTAFLEVRQNHPDQGKHPGSHDHSRFEQCGDSNSLRQHAGCSV